MDDFVVTSPYASTFAGPSAGEAYLLFGRNAGTPWQPNPFDLSLVNGTNGVALVGTSPTAKLGVQVAGVQDVNGDGCNDMLLGTLGDVAYLVFGKNGTWPAAVNLTLGEFDGVTITGITGDNTGEGVGGAGDVNNDGMHDFVIGAPHANPSGRMKAGVASVLYGRPENSPWPTVVNLTTYVNTSTGFAVVGDDSNDLCGNVVSGAGDVNGDGVDDVAVGCINANSGVDRVGLVAVVFGSATALPAYITPSQLNGTNGFVVYGQRTDDSIGTALAPIGDVNADGLDDLGIGAEAADAHALMESGELYVLFGRNDSVTPWPAQLNVTSLDGGNGFVFTGTQTGDFLGQSVSPAGDVNADGIDDLLVGADGADAGRGLAYLLYGRVVWPPTQNSSGLDGSMSQTFRGGTGRRCGKSVSLVGDVNGDGRGDLAIGCSILRGSTDIVFGPLFTSAPTTPSPTTLSPTTAAPTTTAPTTAVPTTIAPSTAAPSIAPTSSPTTASPSTAAPSAAPTASPSTASSVTVTPTTTVSAAPTPTVTSTCIAQGSFVPPGATCVNGVLVTTTNTTVPDGSITVGTSIIVSGGSSFEQPSGTTLVFVVGGSEQDSTSIDVQDRGCASIGGDAVVSFSADPSNGGETGNTGSLVLVTSDCVMGAFGSVTATTSFEDDDCVVVGDGAQQASANSISVSFDVSNTCANKASGLSTGVIVGIIGGAVAIVLLVVAVATYVYRKRVQQREATLAGVQMHRVTW